MRKIKDLVLEYGVIAIVVHYVIFFAVLVGFWMAIRMGWRPTNVASAAGAWGASYIATKVTQPLRIAATVVLTPLIAKLYERVTGRSRRAASMQRPSASPASPPPAIGEAPAAPQIPDQGSNDHR